MLTSDGKNKTILELADGTGDGVLLLPEQSGGLPPVPVQSHVYVWLSNSCILHSISSNKQIAVQSF